MTRRFNFLLALSFTVLFGTLAIAQPNATTVITEDGIMQSNQEAQGKYPPRPKDMWEVGIHFGHSIGGGDVYSSFPSGFGAGVHVRKSLGYLMSIRGSYAFQRFSGTSYYEIPVSQFPSVPASAGTNGFYPAYRTTGNQVNVELLVNLNNLGFHKSTSKWGFYLGAGLSYLNFNTEFNAFNGNNPYNFNVSGADRDNLSTIEGDLDDDYETSINKGDDNDFRDDNAIGVGLPGGISYKLTKQLNISLDNSFYIYATDLLDGRYLSNGGSGTDVLNYTSIRLNFNLGDSKKQSEPLYWVNPLDAPYSLIADNTDRLDNLGDLLADKDGDGVPDKLDKEQNSPAGAVVNTRGETLDSDADGVPDYLDKEPFSAPGAIVNKDGQNTQAKPNYVTKDDLMKMEADRDWVNKETPTVAPQKTAGISNWFLPMINFDNGSSKIKLTAYPALAQVATVLKQNPGVNVVVEGFASSPGGVNSNLRLSYNRAKNAAEYLTSNYGISPSRLTIRYQGEAKPLGGNGASYVNRRVEFRVNDGSETSMSAPQ